MTDLTSAKAKAMTDFNGYYKAVSIADEFEKDMRDCKEYCLCCTGNDAETVPGLGLGKIFDF